MLSSLLCLSLALVLQLSQVSANNHTAVKPNSTKLHNYPANDNNAKFSEKYTELSIGDHVTVALITIGGYSPNWEASENSTGAQSWTYVYQSVLDNRVDDYALLDIKYSAAQAWYQEDDTYVRVEIGEIVSPWRQRKEGDLVVPFWTVIGTLEDGNLVELNWDDFTDNCDTEIEGNCAVKESDCSYNSIDNQGLDCDLKTYIAWTGTDVEGNYLTSKGRTISSFRRWSISKYYDAAAKGITDLPATFEDIEDDIFGG